MNATTFLCCTFFSLIFLDFSLYSIDESLTDPANVESAASLAPQPQQQGHNLINQNVDFSSMSGDITSYTYNYFDKTEVFNKVTTVTGIENRTEAITEMQKVLGNRYKTELDKLLKITRGKAIADADEVRLLNTLHTDIIPAYQQEKTRKSEEILKRIRKATGNEKGTNSEAFNKIKDLFEKTGEEAGVPHQTALINTINRAIGSSSIKQLSQRKLEDIEEIVNTELFALLRVLEQRKKDLQNTIDDNKKDHLKLVIKITKQKIKDILSPPTTTP